MAKFAALLPEILKGNQARRPASVVAIDGTTKIECDLRILMPEDDADIEEAAADFARAHKVADPKPGNSQYERGLMLHTLLRACVDNEVKDKADPYFASIAEVGKRLDDARCLYFFFQQRSFQNEVSPNPKKGGDPMEYLRLLYESAAEEAKGGDPALPFVGLPFGTLVNFAVESVRLLSTQHRTSSDGGSERQDELASSETSAPS
jgi:hypothetical protein